MEKRKVLTIPATVSRFTASPIAMPKKRKVAAYARVSTDSDEQFTSYAAQIDYYTQFINARDDWEFVSVYTDEGITGTSTKHREGFKSMVADALAGKIDLIVTKSVSRFARNTVDSLTTIRQLKEHGVECFFEKENIWTFDGKGELLITIMSSLAQEESRSISENVTWGQRKRMADGKVSVPFGHFLGYKRGPNGELVVDEEQAVTVRHIYEWFLEGLTPHAIAKKLTDMGVPTPRHGKLWHQGTVRSILTNEKYKGDALMQKYYTEDFLTKKQVANKGVLPQYYVEGNHEAIIAPETFELVQREIARRREKKGRYSGVDMFSSRIVCGECGAYYGSKVWHSKEVKYRRVIFRCNRKYDGDRQCATPHVTEEQMKQLFTVALNKLIACRDEIITAMTEDADALYDTSALEAEETRLLGELNVLSERIQAAISENARVALDQTEYQKKFDELDVQATAVKEKHDEIAVAISVMMSKRIAAQKFITTLRKLDGPVEEFNPELWGTLLDHATVYAGDDIRFTFRNGAEIRA